MEELSDHTPLQTAEYYPLLNQTEFKQAIISLGHTNQTGAKLFNIIGNNFYAKSQSRLRHADDIIYYEHCADTDSQQYVLSVAGLNENYVNISQLQGIGSKQCIALFQLIRKFLLEPSESNGDT